MEKIGGRTHNAAKKSRFLADTKTNSCSNKQWYLVDKLDLPFMSTISLFLPLKVAILKHFVVSQIHIPEIERNWKLVFWNVSRFGRTR